MTASVILIRPQSPQIERGSVTVTRGCVGCRAQTPRVIAFRRGDQEEWRTIHMCDPCGERLRELVLGIRPAAAYAAPSEAEVARDAQAMASPRGCTICGDQTRAAVRFRWPGAGAWVRLAICDPCWSVDLRAWVAERSLSERVTTVVTS